jgi:hypothetical protein
MSQSGRKRERERRGRGMEGGRKSRCCHVTELLPFPDEFGEEMGSHYFEKY